MLKILLIIFPFTIFSAYSQSSLPDNFKIGTSVEVYSQDSLKIHFNCTGKIVDKEKASFYRIGRMDSTHVNVVGRFHDYNMNDKIFLKANMQNNSFEGHASYYFNNGKISEEGNYKNNLRVGKWIYYYPNGTIEKIYNHDSVEPTILEAYAKNGKATVINGNGKIHTEFSNDYKCWSNRISGPVLNGKKNGKWTFMVNNIEIYKEGNFIKGVEGNNNLYTDKPKIRLTKFYPNENLNLVESGSAPTPGNFFTLFKYRDSSLMESFYPKLQIALNKGKRVLNNQWLVTGIKIGKDNTLQSVNIASSINDTTLERRIYDEIQTMTDWQTITVNSNEIETRVYFSILVSNNQIIILPYYMDKQKRKNQHPKR